MKRACVQQERGLTLLLTLLCTLALWLAWLPAAAERQASDPALPASSQAARPLALLDDLPPGSSLTDGGPSPVIFPAQRLTLRFNHRLHVKEQGLTCQQCHKSALTSTRSEDSVLPAASECDTCHKTDHRDLMAVKRLEQTSLSECGSCHVDYRQDVPGSVIRFNIPTPNLKFSHAAHAQRNIGCAQCHGAVENVELATREQLPRMRGCLRCHHMPGEARGDAAAACSTCHLGSEGQLQTHFGAGQLLPPRWLHNAEHGADWIERHKAAAAADSAFCANCHQESECVACHDGRVRPRRFHPNDWLNLHSVVADQAGQRCTSCHSEQSFCLTCHQRVGVTQSGPSDNLANRGRFHPPKAFWTDGPKGSMQHHGYQARRNLNACVSCHTERDCVLCHAAGLGGGASGMSPHPPGFATTCGQALRRNARPCLVCHDPADPQLGSCR